MISRNALFGRSRLYVILDREALSGRGIVAAALAAIKGGADLIQLRDKAAPVNEMIAAAKALKKAIGRRKIPLIINDRPEVVLAADADGLHIGRGDIPARLARRIIGRDKILGVSSENYREAAKAKREGADYLGVGPVFRTPVKSQKKPVGLGPLFKAMRLKVPLFAIGGIDAENARMLADSGFKDIAVIRAVCKAKDAFRATRRLKEALG